MVISTTFINIATIAACFISAQASPLSTMTQQAVVLHARQEEGVPTCRYVLRPDSNPELIDVNLPEEFRQALKLAYSDSNTGSIGIDADVHSLFEVSYNGDDSWSWAWFPLLYDLDTRRPWTGSEVTKATEKLIGLTTSTGTITWTIESAGCDPLSTAAGAAGGLRITTIENHQKEGSDLLVKRQGVPSVECAYSLRPDPGSVAALVTVELARETYIVWALGTLNKNRELGLVAISASYPRILSRNRNETWSMVQDVSMWVGPETKPLAAPEVVKAAENLAGYY